MVPSDRTIEDFLKCQIVWLKQGDSPVWQALVAAEECQLILNDFPDEPLYTLRWRGNSLDLDDPPTGWSISRK